MTSRPVLLYVLLRWLAKVGHVLERLGLAARHKVEGLIVRCPGARRAPAVAGLRNLGPRTAVVSNRARATVGDNLMIDCAEGEGHVRPARVWLNAWVRVRVRV